jgi:light-regulated signal transduction histidine kinase (bacteriophytochrome)
MSLTQSRVYPVQSLVSIDSVPITLSARRQPKNDSRPEKSAPLPTRSAASSDGITTLKDLIRPSTPPSTNDVIQKPCATSSIQSFGAAIGLEQDVDGKLLVFMSSDNSEAILGYSPDDLFALRNFVDLLDQQETDSFLEYIASAHDRASYSDTLNVFDLSIRDQHGLIRCLSCVIHAAISRPSLILCEFVPQPSATFTRQSQRTTSRKTRTDTRPPLSRKGSASDTLNTMSKAHRTISVASTIENLLESLVASIKVATGHSDISVHRFDSHCHGRLVAQSDSEENFACYPHSSGPESCSVSPECRTIFETLEIQEHSNQIQETARLIFRPDTTHEHHFESKSLYLRTLPDFPVHGLDEGSGKSRVLIPLRVSGKLWGVVVSKSAPSHAAITFLGRGLCRIIANAASTKLENLNASSVLDARGPFSSNSRSDNKSAVAFASPRDFVKSLRADFAISFIDNTKSLIGSAREPQEGLALVEYLRLRKHTEILSSNDFAADFPMLRYRPGFQSVKGLLFVPLAQDSDDFVVYFRESQSSIQPEQAVDPWTETDLQNAAMMRVVYLKFSAIWKERNSALEESHVYKLLVSNSSHEFRTLLNAISNYLEIAQEGRIDIKVRELVESAKNTSQSLLFAVTKLLDCIEKGLET